MVSSHFRQIAVLWYYQRQHSPHFGLICQLYNLQQCTITLISVGLFPCKWKTTTFSINTAISHYTAWPSWTTNCYSRRNILAFSSKFFTQYTCNGDCHAFSSTEKSFMSVFAALTFTKNDHHKSNQRLTISFNLLEILFLKTAVVNIKNPLLKFR